MRISLVVFAALGVVACGGSGGADELDSGPGIDAASGGRFVDGAEVVLGGSGFGEKEGGGPPVIWATFDEGSGVNGDDHLPTEHGRRQAWDLDSRPCYEESTAIAPAGRSQTLRWNMAVYAMGESLCGVSEKQVDLAAHGLAEQSWYVRTKRYVDFDPYATAQRLGWNFINDKKNRTSPNPDADRDIQPNAYFSFDWGSPSGNGRAPIEGGLIPGSIYFGESYSYPLGQWNTEEMLMRHNSAGNQDGIWQVIINELTVFRSDAVRTREENGDTTNIIGLADHYNSPEGVVDSSEEWWIYFSDVYIDNTWQRVLVGDAPVLEDCTVTEIQVPVSWTDAEIRFIANVGALAGIENRHVFVIGADGAVLHSEAVE